MKPSLGGCRWRTPQTQSGKDCSDHVVYFLSFPKFDTPCSLAIRVSSTFSRKKTTLPLKHVHSVAVRIV